MGRLHSGEGARIVRQGQTTLHQHTTITSFRRRPSRRPSRASGFVLPPHVESFRGAAGAGGEPSGFDLIAVVHGMKRRLRKQAFRMPPPRMNTPDQEPKSIPAGQLGKCST